MKCVPLVVAAFALLATAPAHADTITLTSPLAKSITIFPSGVLEGPFDPDVFGLSVGSIDHLQSGTPLLPVAIRAVYEFDLSGIDPASIAAAAFSFVPTDTTQFGFSCFDFAGCPPLTMVEALGYTGDGIIERAEYHAGALFVGRGEPVFDVPISFVATHAVRGATSGFAGFTINAAGGEGLVGIRGAALQIDFEPLLVPEPGTIFVVGGGLIAIAAAMRRQHR